MGIVLADLAVLDQLVQRVLGIRRTARIDTLASSPRERATLPSSRRRSSVSCGNTTRIVSPSLLGLTPRSLSRIDFSIAPSWVAS